jgi:KaiC/GvpD/RAD55 family RecA-like ATPase
MNFNEPVFIRAIMERPSDARRYLESFQPTWLKTSKYVPILAKIFEFTEEFSTPPSFTILRDLFITEDKTAYDIRYKDTIDELESIKFEDADVLYALSQAKNTMISWSLSHLINRPDFVRSLEEFEGGEVIHELHKWMIQFDGSNEDIERRIDEAAAELIKSKGWNTPQTNIETGIEFLDEWCGGGLRPRQLGIVVAPTGAGKSMTLMIMAYRMSTLGGKRVLFISNELSMGEITERFGTLISGRSIDEVLDVPAIIKTGLSEKMIKWNIHKNLTLVEVNREISTNDIESMISKNVNLYGWTPDVIVIDYMERMKPLASGFKRDNTSMWFGEIAKDLIRMSKRTNTLVWTACQTNRSGFNPDVEQSMAQTQGSMKHLQEASAVVALRKRTDLVLPSLMNTPMKILEFANLKMRHSADSKATVLVEADFSRIAITKNYHRPNEWDKFDKDASGMDVSAGEEKKKKKPYGKRKTN